MPCDDCLGCHGRYGWHPYDNPFSSSLQPLFGHLGLNIWSIFDYYTVIAHPFSCWYGKAD